MLQIAEASGKFAEEFPQIVILGNFARYGVANMSRLARRIALSLRRVLDHYWTVVVFESSPDSQCWMGDASCTVVFADREWIVVGSFHGSGKSSSMAIRKFYDDNFRGLSISHDVRAFHRVLLACANHPAAGVGGGTYHVCLLDERLPWGGYVYGEEVIDGGYRILFFRGRGRVA